MKSWVQKNNLKKVEEALHLVEDYCMAEDVNKENSDPWGKGGRAHEKTTLNLGAGEWRSKEPQASF